jgi:hypothetical protein
MDLLQSSRFRATFQPRLQSRAVNAPLQCLARHGFNARTIKRVSCIIILVAVAITTNSAIFVALVLDLFDASLEKISLGFMPRDWSNS